MRGDLLKTIEPPRIVQGTGRGFHSRLKNAAQSTASPLTVQKAAGIRDVAQSVLERRWFMRRTPRGALGCREATRRTRTVKVLKSNSFIAMNSRFGLFLELVKNFIIVCIFSSLQTYVAGAATSITLALHFAVPLLD